MNKRQKKLVKLTKLLYKQNSKNADFDWTYDKYYKFIKFLYKNDTDKELDEVIEWATYINKSGQA